MDYRVDSNVSKSIVWKILEVIFKRIISFIVAVILARLLNANDYGLIALANIFISFSSIFLDSGISIMLIRKEMVTQEDLDTSRYISLIIAMFVYILSWWLAPVISVFYENDELVPIVRVLMIVIILQAWSVVQKSMMIKQLDFKPISLASSFSSFFSGVLGIILAINGFGVWALVVQLILYQATESIIIVTVSSVKLKLSVSLNRLKSIISFSVGTIFTSILDFLGNNVINFYVGKFINIHNLGLYQKGVLLPETIGLNIFLIINSTLLPVMSKNKCINELKTVIINTISICTYIMLPTMLGLFFITDELIFCLLTEKWMSAAPIMKCFCIYYLFNPLRSIVYNAFYSIGKSSVTMAFEIIRCLSIVLYILLLLKVGDCNLLVVSVGIAANNVIFSISIMIYTFFYFKLSLNDVRLDMFKGGSFVYINDVCPNNFKLYGDRCC